MLGGAWSGGGEGRWRFEKWVRSMETVGRDRWSDGDNVSHLVEGNQTVGEGDSGRHWKWGKKK
jgi:hypothetical protein